MQIWGITDRGAVRRQNQDSYAMQTLDDGRVVGLVCDGMGGALAGNVASSMAVQLFMEQFMAAAPDAEDQERLQHAAAVANEQVYRRSHEDPECMGMGTTLVAALAGETMATIINEGDSRAYHIGPQGITLVTRDHSLVEDLVRRGELTREEAKRHPNKNLITRALGAESVLMTDCFRQELAEGEYLLLCSDGLSNVVEEQEMLYEVVHGGDNETCCRRLLDIALERGAPDNVTAVLIRR